MDQEEIVNRAAKVVHTAISSGGLGLLSTASSTGNPHATWMATMGVTEPGELLALTSPDSRKVANILDNPKVEWLFTGEDQKDLVYLSGFARIVTDTKAIKSYWDLMPEKDRAFFLDHFNSGIGFSIILTEINSANLVCPELYQSYTFGAGELWKR